MTQTDRSSPDAREQADDSGFARILGMRVVELEHGRAVVAMHIDERLDNWIGLTHGGAIMALADQALGTVASTLVGHPVAIQFNINFLGASPKGQDVFATARIVHSGRRVSVFDFDVRDCADRLIAHGQATGIARPAEKT